jgi:outer membrane lipoprotein-sorting protein
MITRSAALCLALLTGLTVYAAEPPTLSANELAARLSAKQQDGTSYVRLKMEVKQPSNSSTTLQLQIKSRASRTGTELVYQVLWPKERKGEAVLLRKAKDRAPTGAIYIPPNAPKPLDASQMRDALFGSDLSYEDVIENFFAWDQQVIVATEAVDRVNCQVLESKPGKGERSSYSSVRTWVDTRRMVPLRIEKYGSGGKLVRRIETTRVADDDNGHPIPANLTVRGPRGDGTTELDGSRIRHGVALADDEFTPEKLKDSTTPKAE